MDNQTRIATAFQFGLINQEDMMYLIGYIKLNTNDFKIILKWKNQDWNKYFDYKHKVGQNQLYNNMMECENDSDSD